MSDTLGKAPHAPWDRVEWRVQGKVDRGGVTVVAYLDRATVADLLDDWVGPLGWRDDYEPAGKQGVMWCLLDVLAAGRGEWVRKKDVGTASNMEAEKGLVSDAFKRVAMGKWGVGRNVYDLPVLRLPEGTFDTWQDRNGETQARLTDASRTEIVRLLRARGLEDAADATRVHTGGSEQTEPAAEPEPGDDGPGIDLSPLEPVIAEAGAAGVLDDPNGARAYARQSEGHRDALIARLRGKIDELAADGEHQEALAATAAVDGGETW